MADECDNVAIPTEACGGVAEDVSTVKITTSMNAAVPSPSTSASSPSGTAEKESPSPSSGQGDGPTEHEDPSSSKKSAEGQEEGNCPAKADKAMAASAEQLQAGITFSDLMSPKEFDESKRNALEIRLRTVRDILKRQTEVNEKLMRFCMEAQRWMADADAEMRRQNISPQSLPPQPIMESEEEINAAAPYNGVEETSSCGGILSAATAEPSRPAPAGNRHFAPRGHTESEVADEVTASKVSSPKGRHAEVYNTIMSLLGTNQQPTKPQHHTRQNFIQPMFMGTAFNRQMPNQPPNFDYDCDSENEDPMPVGMDQNFLFGNYYPANVVGDTPAPMGYFRAKRGVRGRQQNGANWAQQQGWRRRAGGGRWGAASGDATAGIVPASEADSDLLQQVPPPPSDNHVDSTPQGESGLMSSDGKAAKQQDQQEQKPAADTIATTVDESIKMTTATTAATVTAEVAQSETT